MREIRLPWVLININGSRWLTDSHDAAVHVTDILKERGIPVRSGAGDPLFADIGAPRHIEPPPMDPCLY